MNIRLRPIITDLIVIGLVAFSAGAVFNSFYPDGYRLRAANDNIIAINTQLAKTKFDESAFFLDARTPKEFDAGHVSGAVNLDVDNYLALIDQVYDRIEKAPVIVVYCSDAHCDRADKLAHNRLGIVFKGKTIYIMTSGIAGWQARGYPVERKQ